MTGYTQYFYVLDWKKDLDLLKYVSASVFFVPGQTDFFMEKINVTNKEFINIFKK
jgi:hypothetical protein